MLMALPCLGLSGKMKLFLEIYIKTVLKQYIKTSTHQQLPRVEIYQIQNVLNAMYLKYAKAET